MTQLKDIDRLASVEFCLGRYLDNNVGGVMHDVRNYLGKMQAKELKDGQNSFTSFLSAGASASIPGVDNNLNVLKATGEWNSKTTDDYIKMCKDKIHKNKDLMHDLTLLTVEWRTTLISEIGEKRYNEASKKLGGDLAGAYIDYRIQEKMVEELVNADLPKGTTDYIIKKASENSLIGLSQVLTRTDLENRIAKEANERYKASGVEYTAARAVSFGMDTISTGGFSSWTSLCKLAGMEVVLVGAEKYTEHQASKNPKKEVTVEQTISQGVFNSQKNVFEDVRNRANLFDAERNKEVQRLNSGLARKVETRTFNGLVSRGLNIALGPVTHAIHTFNDSIEDGKKRVEEEKKLEEEKAAQLAAEDAKKESEKTGTEPQTESNQLTWGKLLTQFGLNGMGDIRHNLGYVIAMMPDILIGTLTGKTESLKIQKNIIPMASVVAGMFVKNPILKTVMIGMGGMNLLNKAGHESLDIHDHPEKKLYKSYQDEPLNPRIASPVINGNCLVADIDKMPCSIMLPDKVVEAYKCGALPINTLANAVLAKHDAGNAIARTNYNSLTTDNQNNIHIR